MQVIKEALLGYSMNIQIISLNEKFVFPLIPFKAFKILPKLA